MKTRFCKYFKNYNSYDVNQDHFRKNVLERSKKSMKKDDLKTVRKSFIGRSIISFFER